MSVMIRAVCQKCGKKSDPFETTMALIVSCRAGILRYKCPECGYENMMRFQDFEEVEGEE